MTAPHESVSTSVASLYSTIVGGHGQQVFFPNKPSQKSETFGGKPGINTWEFCRQGAGGKIGVVMSLSSQTSPAKAHTQLAEGDPRGCGWLFFMVALVIAAGWGAILGMSVWILEVDAGKTMQALEEFRPKVGSKVFSSDGEKLGEFAIEARQLISLNEIPLRLQKAFIATEDHTFYEHKGVRPVAWLSVAKDAIRTGNIRGASTITQQIVRNIDTTEIDKNEITPQRKFREMVVALQLERELTKDEILELYLNQIFLGISAHGVESAARQYFNKSASELTLGESALLAGLTRAPNANEPFNNPVNAKTRRDIVLNQMHEHGFITLTQRDAAKAESVDDSVVTPEERAAMTADGDVSLWALNRFEAPYFVEEVRKFISKPPPPFEVSADQEELFEGGLEIYTSIDMRLQEAAEGILFAAMDDFDEKKRKQYESRGRMEDFVPVSAALVCIDNRPGYEGLVRAMVGGRDFQQKKFNVATQALRQPGSSIKPFVYLTAIDRGMTPSSIVVDEPFVRRAGSGTMWAPKNFGGEFLGPIALQWALDKSVNIVSVKLVERLGMSTVRSYIRDAGFKQPIPDSVSLTLGLGTPETTVLDQAVMYSTLANMGTRHDPVLVTEIRDRDGVTRFDYRDFPERKHVNAVPPDSAYVVVRMLEGVATADRGRSHYPSGWRTEALERPRAGKTGTTNDSRDVWFCGFTPQFTTVVWFGYENNQSLGSGTAFTGGQLASPVWTEFMKVAHEGLPVLEFQPPPGVDTFDIDRKTGFPGGNWKAAFKKGTSPRVWAPPPPAEPLRPALNDTTALLEQL